jgi:hypothetical protein
MRKEVPEVGWGDFTVIPSRDPAVLVMRAFRGAFAQPPTLRMLIWPEARNRPRLADLAAVAYDASSNVIGMRAFRGADVIREALHADDEEAGRDGRSSNKSPAARCSPHRLRCSRPPLERWGAAAVAGRARRTETATRSPLHPIPPVRRAW